MIISTRPELFVACSKFFHYKFCPKYTYFLPNLVHVSANVYERIISLNAVQE